jgi:hypothetical protein
MYPVEFPPFVSGKLVSGRRLLPDGGAQLVSVLRANLCTNALRREHQADGKISYARRAAVAGAKTLATADA